MPPNAFIFDLDGTLVNSLLDIADALNAARAAHGMGPVSAQEAQGWIGDGLQTLCRRACVEADPATLQSIVRSALEYYSAHSVVHTKPYDNILIMLELLKSRGVRLAVLSNKPHRLTVEVVRRLSLSPFFEIVQGPNGEADRKPDPGNALRIAAQLGQPPHRVCLVGDSPVDIQTARNAGMIAVAVTWGFRGKAELVQAYPDHLVDDPLAIIKIIFQTAAEM